VKGLDDGPDGLNDEAFERALGIVKASKIRKGQFIVIGGTKVRVTKREKWSSTEVHVHFEDAGQGLPASPQYGLILPMISGESKPHMFDTFPLDGNLVLSK
jgi:nitrogen-specific signal transduction histidine kinase